MGMVSRFAATGVAAGLFGLALVCCTQKLDLPPASKDPGSTTVTGGGGGGGGGGDSGTGGSSGCNTLPAGPTVPEMQVADNAPTPIGGTIAPGTYTLSTLNKYTGVGGAVGASG